jgi:arabinogalactan endo-1,4-beta-galactosidase
MRRVVIFLMGILMGLSACSGMKATGPVPAGIFVEKIPDLHKDFIMGSDISSVLALEKSGVVFYNEKGRPTDFFKLLADGGHNYVRVRVWNDPFDDQKRGYGGGNCDAAVAAEIGRRAAKHGMKLLVNFHYADFWADPGKQPAPKAWEGMDLNDKADALYNYTLDSLRFIKDAGADIGMVQIGNETNNGMAGEEGFANMVPLFKAGVKAVRDFDPNILIALHFTNPETEGRYAYITDQLYKGGVDYDVFASSYYPFWHGTLDNLEDLLKTIITTYDKKVLIAEIAYAYTYDDGDGFPNIVGRGNNLTYAYPVSVHGQAYAVREAAAMVSRLGEYGLGIFYWEPAWLPAPRETWDSFGSGWASRYAASYDPKDAGQYFGGTSVDNQAFFDFNGHPLPTLNIYDYLRTGAFAKENTIDLITGLELSFLATETVEMPETVEAVYIDGSRKPIPVVWDQNRINAIMARGAGDYIVTGISEAAPGIAITAKVAMEMNNLLLNPGWEESDTGMWVILASPSPAGHAERRGSDARSGSYSLHFWDNAPQDFTVEQTVKELASGTYSFSVFLHGGDGGPDADIYIYAKIDGEEAARVPAALLGWRNYSRPELTVEVMEGQTLTVGVAMNCAAGGWGAFDDFLLYMVE